MEMQQTQQTSLKTNYENGLLIGEYIIIRLFEHIRL